MKKPKILAKHTIRLLALIAAAVLCASLFNLAEPNITPLLNAPSTVEALTTEEKIKQAEADKKKAEEEKKRAEEARKAVERERWQLELANKNLREVLAELAAELEQINADIAQLETDIADKEAEITESEEQLAEAIRIKEEQYEAMKIRLKYLYEQQDHSSLDTLFSATSLAEFLNMADYIDQLTDYDQMKLDEYREIERLVTERRDTLTLQKIELDTLLIKAEAQQDFINDNMERTDESIAYYSNQIAIAERSIEQKEREMLEIENEIKRQADNIEKFKIQLAEEIRLRELAKQKVWRNISDIQFAENDRYLLASIIFCEAGGESYAGKLAVASVVINRMRSPVFPNTMEGVIYAPRQFSPVASGRLALAMSQGKATASCYQAADEAMQGVSNVGDCLFFRTPIQGLVGTYVIGGHVFY
uniref:Cell wall hydrolase, SleB n=1 Tax=uncultured bacterium contig00048 TaxID=1181533 RepID=A0A806KP64_9BACT|nr:cell wall hydrolase, SleB [uncultured bacterium contig00048]